MALSLEKRNRISEVISEWDNLTLTTTDTSTPFDWRSKALTCMRDGNINRMKLEAAPLAEYKILDIMQNGETEALQLDAAKYILSQAGHGPVQKVDHNITYEKMDTDQLGAILQSRLTQLKQLLPELSIDGKVVDVEIVEEEEVNVK